MNLTRRDFAKLSALSLAARFAPNLHAETSTPRKTGYCVIGLGRIAGHFMPAVRSTTTSQITGLVSGHRDKAERIAAEYGVPASSIYNYENFDEIAHNPAIDAVYVALPNSMHAEYTIRAARAGKHVLCEKPMSTNVAEADVTARILCLSVLVQSAPEGVSETRSTVVLDSNELVIRSICCEFTR